MSLCTVNFFGPSIGKENGMHVILPDGKGPFPVMYLLHGLSDDYTIWQRRTSIERYVAGLGLIVVIPDGARSFYVNDPRPGGLAYDDYITKDVVGFVDHTFRTIASARGRAIAGLSMGGYGATVLAMRHPDVFSTAVSHSGALGFCERQTYQPPFGPLKRALEGKGYNVFELARKLKRAGKRIAYRLDCGTEDHLIEDNRRFHAHLTKIGFAHEYAEHPGEHNWAYWDLHIQETIRFVMANVKRDRR
ncbi:MAG: alpha/beta hydrolase [Phycisphaerae bacterium]